jgi:pyruvate/2-oxoglutarate/acetoin dehydrogenase E1 component
LRTLTYAQAISEALVIGMRQDPKVFITGIGVDYPVGVFGTTREALDEFGSSRVFDSPSMENALTGICIGASAMGMRPVIVHHRNDFMFLAFDQMINLAAKWRYMYGGNAGQVPIVVRGIIGRGWGQGATHSQSLQSPIAHFPGIAVVMPAMPADAKGLILSALKSPSPVVILEHRSLFDIVGEVPEGHYETPIGKANILKVGSDISVVCTSYMVVEAMRAAEFLSQFGISVEVIDLRSIRPLDEETIIDSVRKTGKLVVADTSWVQYGVASEIAALIAEKAFEHLKAPVVRIGIPNSPAPSSKILEDAFYPSADSLQKIIAKLLGRADIIATLGKEIDNFKGPY